MRPRPTRMLLLVMASLAGCQCADRDLMDLDRSSASSSSGDELTGSSGSSEGSTGEPFDASRWIGRYHFEHTFVPFGEHGDVDGASALTNFEILPGGRATMFHDNCYSEEAISIVYDWLPAEDGWLALHPGPGETSLRFEANPDVESLRVKLIEPCRELEFDVEGRTPSFTIVRPGESCWVDRCTTPHGMQIDYCEGEEPEVTCP